MGRMGMGEILVVLIIALVIFGPKQLPKLGKTLGKAFGQFKHYTDMNWDMDDDDEDDAPVKKKKKKETVKENTTDEEPDSIEEEKADSAEA